jgi:hypothetical protein
MLALLQFGVKRDEVNRVIPVGEVNDRRQDPPVRVVVQRVAIHDGQDVGEHVRVTHHAAQERALGIAVVWNRRE